MFVCCLLFWHTKDTRWLASYKLSLDKCTVIQKFIILSQERGIIETICELRFWLRALGQMLLNVWALYGMKAPTIGALTCSSRADGGGCCWRNVGLFQPGHSTVRLTWMSLYLWRHFFCRNIWSMSWFSLISIVAKIPQIFLKYDLF